MKTLSTQIENLINNSQYNEAVNLVAKKFNIKLKIIDSTYKCMQWDKNQPRYVFKLQLLRGCKSYTFEFGQSIAEGSNEPTLYDVLTCLQKYDVGTFEDFCGMFGYNLDSILERKKAKTIYKAVVKEFNAMERLFDSEELEVLQMIN
jgi:hypothetical protein